MSKDIAVTAYSPLGSTGALFGHRVVNEIAERKGVSPYAILLSIWANKDRISVLSKSVTPERIRGEWIGVVILFGRFCSELAD